ncbi:MAG TPA: DUF2480 family protein [Flavobacteriaceae bacterium]|nr:DUF2480 family protein [Flavobacteriaceae bacterium]
MANNIVNRVANSKLITFDLEEYYPKNTRMVIDVSIWLFEGFILKEKDFRQHLKNYNWQQYKNNYVALTCTTDAIIPAWAYMLIATYLVGISKKTVVGDLTTLEQAIFYEIIENLDISTFTNKPVIIKGCSNKPIPQTAYIQLIEKLQPVVKSIMFGEACSSVPLFKKK